MPLNKIGLSSGLENIFAQTNISGTIVATQMAFEISNYWATGLSSVGGTVISLASIPVMTPLLIPAFEGPKPTSSITVSLMTTAIMAGVLTLIIVGPTHGAGGVISAVDSVLKLGLEPAFAPTPNMTGQLHAKLMADAIHNFTMTTVTWGTGNPALLIPPPPPGPIS